ncbi:MAG: DUF3347 domain-containing protein [Chitinophagaceae bacterium]
MKKIFFTVAFLATAFVQQSIAQDSTSQPPLSQLLQSYYAIKNALVAGNAVSASTNADRFVTSANGIDSKAIPAGSITALVKDASQISATKDIKHQREHFANFSTNMFALAKAVKLTSDPIYEAYCPMTKANWLSSDKAIKNPYFGSSMLSCGKVVETINQ